MAWDDDDDDVGADFPDAECVKETKDAVLIAMGPEEKWVPKSVIHDDSEVWRLGDSGVLILKEWFAEKEGWI